MPGSDLNLPPMTPSELPSSEGHSNPLNSPEEGSSGMLSLTPDQLSALGLEDCQPGDTYTIKIKKADSEGGGADFEVEDVAEGDGDNDEDDGMPGQADEGQIEAPDADTDTAIPGLSAAPDDKGATPPGEANAGSNGAEAKLGFKRKKKTPRGGLPSTMKLRE